MAGMTLSNGVPLKASEERWIAEIGLTLQVQVEDFIDYPVGHGVEVVAHALDFRLAGGCVASQTDIGPHLVMRWARPRDHVMAQRTGSPCPFGRCRKPCGSVGTL